MGHPIIKHKWLEWVIRKSMARVVGLKYVPHVGYEPGHLLDIVGPEV